MTAVPEVVARFEREAVAAGRIEHPNVVQASDFGRLDDGAFYLVLEYVEGQSLAKVIERGPVAPERALHITRQVADALAAAHAQNIIHRDLKPDNVMIVDRENYRGLRQGARFRHREGPHAGQHRQDPAAHAARHGVRNA